MKMATKLMLMEEQQKKEKGGHEGNKEQYGGQGRYPGEHEAKRYGHEPGFGNDYGESRMHKQGMDPMSKRHEDYGNERHEHEDDYSGRQKAQGQRRGYESEDDEEDDRGSHKHKGNGQVDEWQARRWVSAMQGEDGKSGEHYTPEKAAILMRQHCPECDKWEWYVAINMMHSDYGPIAKQVGVDCDTMCAMMAKAFLKDEDAAEGKLEKYMEAIPKK